MLVNTGYGNIVMSSKAVAPMRSPKDDAKERNIQVGATQGSIVITDSDDVILSVDQVETLAQHLFGGDAA
jgi:regulator of extracellular matrix RemA (YlzA/DUF370 family)